MVLAGGCAQQATSERQPALASATGPAPAVAPDAQRGLPAEVRFDGQPSRTSTPTRGAVPPSADRPIEPTTRTPPAAGPPTVVTRPAPQPTPPPAPPPPQQAPQKKPPEEIEPPRGPHLTDLAIAALIVKASRASYAGNCPCPYNVDRGGRRCGGRSAYTRPGGRSPLCYERDVSAEMIAGWRKNQRQDQRGASEESQLPSGSVLRPVISDYSRLRNVCRALSPPNQK